MTVRSQLAPFVIALLPLATAAFELAAPACARAGAWTRPAGGVFWKVGVDHWSTPDRLDEDGRRVGYAAGIHDAAGGGRYSATALRGYLEYGWREGWTAIAAGSFERRVADYGIATLSTAGPGGLELGLRRRLPAGPLVAAIQADARVPTFYDPGASPALGTGKLDGGGRLLVGGSTGSLYATAEAGWLARGGERGDELPFAVEAGWSPRATLLVKGEIRGSRSMGGGAGGASAVPGMFDPALASARWLTAGGAIVLRGMPLDVVLDATHVLEGRNTLAGTRVGLSVWFER